MAERLAIRALGRAGDGVADTAGGPVHVPFTLPGETVLADRRGTRAALVSIETPAPGRVVPVCRHFGVCGGCQLQMMPLEGTRAWKRGLVAEALSRAGLTAEVAPTVETPAASRRRLVLSSRRVGTGVALGLKERGSDRIVDMRECHVAVPAIAGRLDALRQLLAPLLGNQTARVAVLATSTGLDVDVAGGVEPGGRAFAALAPLMEVAGAVRLSLGGRPLLMLAEPALDVGGVAVVPPPGGFVQANATAERAMAALVTEHLSGAARAVDLFSGFGTFALRLAREMPVHAVEADGRALDALGQAVRRASGLKPVSTERRDLFRQPLGSDELRPFDALVFDPPEKGAEAQAEAIAGSGVARVAAVSCDPWSFARDAARLVAGGYSLERVVPVDQFTWSAATELVGLFVRPATPRRPRRRAVAAPSRGP